MKRDFNKLKVFDESSPPDVLRGSGAFRDYRSGSPKDAASVCGRGVFVNPIGRMDNRVFFLPVIR